MRPLASSLLALTIFSSHLFATNGDSLQAQVDYRSEGLNVIGVLIDERGFFDEWQKPEMPKIKPVDTYRRGDEVIPILIFSTSAKDQNGNADLTYDITIRKPDGSVYGHQEKLTVWQGAPAPMMHLVKQPLVIRLERTDPLGIYTISTTVFENVRQQKVPMEFSFRVIEDSVLSSDEMNHQLTFFYRKPNLLLLPALMRTVDKAGILTDKSAQSPMVGFFTVVMSSAFADSQSVEETINQLVDGRSFFSYCYSLSRNRDTILNWDGHDPSVNDMLWGAFFASGDRRVIERLVSEMRFCSEEQSVHLYLTGASAKWSLCSNAKQHPAVRTYLEEMVGKVPPQLADYLQETLNADPGALREQMMNGVQRFKNKD